MIGKAPPGIARKGRELAPDGFRIEPLSDNALIIEFGSEIDEDVSRRVHGAAARLEALCGRWNMELVPSYTTLALFLLPGPLLAEKGTFGAFRAEVEAILSEPAQSHRVGSGRTVEIPVCYGGEYGPDLDEVASSLKVSPDEVIRLHSDPLQYIFLLGFAPGLPVIGLTGPRLNLPRRTTPRVEVPARSVAIANRQTVIYPLPVPGGWHLIGRTPSVPFDVNRDPICLFGPGDRVRFKPISPGEFEELEAKDGD